MHNNRWMSNTMARGALDQALELDAEQRALVVSWIAGIKDKVQDIEPMLSERWERKPALKDLILALVARDYAENLPAEFRGPDKQAPLPGSRVLAQLRKKLDPEFDGRAIRAVFSHDSDEAAEVMDRLEESRESMDNLPATLQILRDIRTGTPDQPTFLNLLSVLNSHFDGKEEKPFASLAALGLTEIAKILELPLEPRRDSVER